MKVSSAIAAFVIIGFGLCARELVAQRIQPAVITQGRFTNPNMTKRTSLSKRCLRSCLARRGSIHGIGS